MITHEKERGLPETIFLSILVISTLLINRFSGILTDSKDLEFLDNILIALSGVILFLAIIYYFFTSEPPKPNKIKTITGAITLAVLALLLN